MEKEILIKGNLHIYNVPWAFFDSKGVVIHVENDVFIYNTDEDFIYPKSDTFFDLKKTFEEQGVKDIIAYSPKFKQKQ